MILETPLILHPSQWRRPRPTSKFEEDERFIEEQILQEWVAQYLYCRRDAGELDPGRDTWLPFIRDPWEVDEVAFLVRNAMAGNSVRVNPNYEPGDLFIIRGMDDRFYVFEGVGSVLNRKGRPVFLEDAQVLPEWK